MRKIIAFTVVFALMFALAVPALAVDVPVVNMQAGQVTGVTIDGTLDDGFTGPFPIAFAHPGTEDEPNLTSGNATGNAWFAWNPEALYFYIEVYDITPNNGGERADQVEVYIAWNGPGTSADRLEEGIEAGWGIWPAHSEEGFPWYQITIPSSPDAFGDQILDGMLAFDDGSLISGEGAGYEFDDMIDWITTPLNGSFNNGYVVEMRVPLAEGVEPLYEGRVIWIDFAINDNMFGEGRDAHIWLNNSPANNMQWCIPASYTGRVTLQAEAPVIIPDDGGAQGGEGGDAGAGAGGGGTGGTAPTGDAGMIALIALLGLAAGAVVLLRKRATR